MEVERKRLESERVRTIMRRYLEIRPVPALIEILCAEGVVTKIQQRTSDPHRAGIPFARGSLFHLLTNPVYRGKIVHKGKFYDGEHEPIADEELWDRVQAQLREKAPPRRWPTTNDRQQAMLRGLLTDPHDPQDPAHLLNAHRLGRAGTAVRLRRLSCKSHRKMKVKPGPRGQRIRHIFHRIAEAERSLRLHL